MGHPVIHLQFITARRSHAAAYFLTREEDEWYRPSRVADQDFGTAESRSDLEVSVATEGRLDQSFFENPESYRVQI